MIFGSTVPVSTTDRAIKFSASMLLSLLRIGITGLSEACRKALLELLADPTQERSLPEFWETIESSPAKCLTLIAAS